MSEAVLGFDIGTSGIRIAAADRQLNVLALAEARLAAPLQTGFRILQDPAIWLSAMDEALGKLALQLAGHRVLALAVDGTSGTILPIDDAGKPAGLASMYNDLGEPEDVARIKSVAPPETAALGGTSALARALPLKQKFLHQADWLAGQFSGRFDVSDENNALKTGYDPVARAWPQWMARTGMALSLLPKVVPAGMRTGTITPDMAKRYSLPADVAIVAGTTDGCAAFLASGASQPGDGVTSLGSTLTLKLLSATPVFAPQYGIYSHRIGDQWLAGGASNTGGAALASLFSREDIARLTPLLKPEEATGLDYYPLSSPGERFPIADPAYEPRLTPRPADERLFFQGVLEGIAAVEALGYRRLAELGASPLKTIRSVGGGSANAPWTQIRLRTLGVPELPARSDHACIGVARLAWRGIGHAA